jgi:hypothetical protein
MRGGILAKGAGPVNVETAASGAKSMFHVEQQRLRISAKARRRRVSRETRR